MENFIRHFTVVGNTITDSRPIKKSGNVGENNVTSLSFTFSEEWDNAIVSIVFRTPSYKLLTPQTVTNGLVEIPVDALDVAGTLQFSLMGAFADSNKVLRTPTYGLEVEATLNILGGTPLATYTNVVLACQLATTSANTAAQTANDAATSCAETEQATNDAEAARVVAENARAEQAATDHQTAQGDHAAIAPTIAEVMDARGTFANVKERLDGADETIIKNELKCGIAVRQCNTPLTRNGMTTFFKAHMAFDSDKFVTQGIYAIPFAVGGTTQTSIYYSGNGGISWETIGSIPSAVDSGERIIDLYVVAYNGNIIVLKQFGTASPYTYKVLTYDKNLALLGSLDIGQNYWHSSHQNIDSYRAGVLMAEYSGTGSATTRRVWRSWDGGATWSDRTGSVAGLGTIKHFHVAQHDPYSHYWYLCSGDGDAECKIWRSQDGASFTLLKSGSQAFRTLGFVFDATYLYFAMDSPDINIPSKLYRASKDMATIEEICTLKDGLPAYGICRSFYPAGFFIFPAHEANSAEISSFSIQFYDFRTQKVYDVASFGRFAKLQSDNYGFNDACRYQCPYTSIIIANTINFNMPEYVPSAETSAYGRVLAIVPTMQKA